MKRCRLLSPPDDLIDAQAASVAQVPLALLKEAYLNQVKGFRAAAILANGTGAIFRAPVDPERVSERVLEAEARRSISSPATGLCLSPCASALNRAPESTPTPVTKPVCQL